MYDRQRNVRKTAEVYKKLCSVRLLEHAPGIGTLLSVLEEIDVIMLHLESVLFVCLFYVC